MCFQFLNKFFGANRRRSAAANGGISPRPSLANGPQVSIDTVRTVKSAKSVNPPAANRVVTVVNVGNNSKMGHSVNSLGLERRQSVAAGSAGGALSNNASAAATAAGTAAANTVDPGSGVSGAGNNRNHGKRSSVWGFIGITKKKSRSSNESI
ncbi:uncharacterized protein LOC110184453 [Drosophila serrata]|uniref:uncharacterized protein LOC110184453 n=1 Tax=Drosophila serrata TaxID=7274 RepID=UPI000A1D2AF2|nr:uncharacterized protein LOC110184453 [Drosophila serrata]KAH8356169.1 hypothetical protein KR200_002518 [Drosophila serrata]